jgi:predicted Zn-dependent protease
LEYEHLKDELLSNLDSGLKYAQKAARDAECELYLFYRNQAKVDIKQGAVEAIDGVVNGNAVRVASQQRVSFASSSGISIDRIKRSIDEAVASVRLGSFTDARFKGFCEPKPPGKEGHIAREILNLSKEDLIQYATSLIKAGRDVDKRIHAAESSCSADWGGFAVGNTRGLQQASRSAANGCTVTCMAKKNDERKVAYEYDITRDRLMKPDGLGQSAAQKAIDLLDARKLGKTTTLPTIWVPDAAAAYLYASVGQSISGRAVVEGLSPLADQIGKEIGSPNLTIIDDGQDPSSLNTEAVDAEGHPQQRTVIVDKGTLRHFTFDTYYARLHKAESTGNSSRGGGAFGSSLPYEASPSISTKSLEVLPGRKRIDDLASLVGGQAILIADTPIGIFHSSLSTGEFSAVAQSAFLVQNGERKWSLQPISVSGNFYKGFMQLVAVGNDLRQTPLSVETPSLVFNGFSIVG